MRRIAGLAAALACSVVSTSAFAADYDGEYIPDVERETRVYDGERWDRASPRVGIVIGDRRRGYGYCSNWRDECADRWGWGGRRFHRCLDRHGC